MLKNALSDLQNKIGEIIKPIPLHPNDITILSIILAIIGSYYVWNKDIAGMFFIILAFVMDGLDGALAHAKNLTTNYGAYLDGVSDRIVEFFALLPLFFSQQLMTPALFVLFFGSCMTSFCKAYADHREVVDSKTAAKLKTILPRSERTIGIFIVLTLYLFNYIQEASYILWIVAILSISSVIYLQYDLYLKSGHKI
ncbi:MAG: CDP-alcohol phosphatidyltransferase family protein [Candidatus Micrarchaeota archaeon]